MNVRGKIEYKLWTVTGEKKLQIAYIINESNGEYGVGSLKVKGESDVPDLDYDTMQDIIRLCVEDAHEKDERLKNSLLVRVKMKTGPDLFYSKN